MLARALSDLLNHERIGAKSCELPGSRVIKGVLELLLAHRYIGPIEERTDRRGSRLTVTLIGAINGCGVIKPRHAIALADYAKFEARYLPAKDFGILIVSTSKGLMDHVAAKAARLGGRLIAYCY